MKDKRQRKEETKNKSKRESPTKQKKKVWIELKMNRKSVGWKSQKLWICDDPQTKANLGPLACRGPTRSKISGAVCSLCSLPRPFLLLLLLFNPSQSTAPTVWFKLDLVGGMQVMQGREKKVWEKEIYKFPIWSFASIYFINNVLSNLQISIRTICLFPAL